MNNEFGYIDTEPFEKVNLDKQNLIILNTKDDLLEIKINGVDKYDIFEMFPSDHGKLIESKLYYGINSKYYPITFFNANIRTTSYSPISSTTIISKMYAIGREAVDPIKHLTPTTKLKKFDYYNDKLIYYYSNNPMSIKRADKKNGITLNATTNKPQKLFTLKYNNDNIITVYLIHSYNSSGNMYDFTIKPNTYLQIKFKKSVSIDDVLRVSARIDSTLHMCILNRNRNYLITVYDFSKRSYNFYNYKQKKYEQEERPIFNICKNKEDLNRIFQNLLSLLINIDFECSNSYLPFINFNKDIGYYEIEFLQYYKVLEVIDFEKQKLDNNEKDKYFLKKYLTKYSKLKDYFFKDADVVTLESEIRSLRNYYSHEGFYVKKLPIPTTNPKRYKEIDVQWIYDVKRLVKIIAYNEIYDKANVDIDELELTKYLF